MEGRKEKVRGDDVMMGGWLDDNLRLIILLFDGSVLSVLDGLGMMIEWCIRMALWLSMFDMMVLLGVG